MMLLALEFLLELWSMPTDKLAGDKTQVTGQQVNRMCVAEASRLKCMHCPQAPISYPLPDPNERRTDRGSFELLIAPFVVRMGMPRWKVMYAGPTCQGPSS